MRTEKETEVGRVTPQGFTEILQRSGREERRQARGKFPLTR
jgi:hypothetical protein